MGIKSPVLKKIWKGYKYSTFDPFNRFRRDAYSLEGEDLILRRFFGKFLKDGFYVDVGAYHPKAASNTMLFYRRGWHGINIDARPGSIARFRRARPRDINLEIAVSDVPTRLNYYCFDLPALNTFSVERVRELEDLGRRPLRVIEIETRRLDDILDRYAPPGKKLDFLSVDVEGFDLQVLKSNDWDRFRFEFVLVETLDWKVADAEKSGAIRYIEALGYGLVARTVNTSIFRLS